MGKMVLKDREPCEHPGCLHHISHPCEGCGRVGGRRQDDILIKALEDIRDQAKKWEGREKVPFWNLGDRAAAALKKYNKADTAAVTDQTF